MLLMTEKGEQGKYRRDYVANAPLIRRLRTQKHRTLKNLEKASDVNFTTLSRIENGKNRSPHWDTLERLAEAFGVPADDLVIYPELAGVEDINRENIQKAQDFIDEIPEEDESEDDELDGDNS